jgi:hypothetical protein
VESDEIEVNDYPSVIRRVETGVPEQPVLYEWVSLTDGNTRWDDPYRALVVYEPWPNDPHFRGWYAAGGPDDEAPDFMENEAEALEWLYKQGPPSRVVIPNAR